MRMQERLSTEKADITNATTMQNLESGVETLNVHPSQVRVCDLLPFAKLQKSQLALQELVTATLQRAGPPRRISCSMSQTFAPVLVMRAG
jgi:hypothetical protein